MINGITFSEQMFTSADFAHFMYTFLNHANGITKGCEISNADGNVYIQKGYFMQCGRMVRIIGTEEIPSPEVVSGQLYCKVVFEIDLTKSNTIEEFNQGYFRTLTGTAAYPEMTQEDLDNDGTLHQIPWCQYIKTAEGISEFEDIREVIDVTSVWELYEDLNAHTSDKNNPHGIKAGDIGAATANDHRIRQYRSLSDLGITNGSETILGIIESLPTYSRLAYAVGTSNNASEYPSAYGFCIIEKSEHTRVSLEFYVHYADGKGPRMFLGWGTYTSSDGAKFSGWQNVALAKDFLPLAGGTLSGSDLYLSGGVSRVTSGENIIQIETRDAVGDTNNRRFIVLGGNIQKANVADSLILSQILNGVQTSYRIFGEHNTVPVKNGGTGATTLASGAVLIGNGTGAVQTRPITNNTTGASASGTNIPTCNTLNHHVQFWLNRGAAVHQANTGYTTYMARGIALVTAVPSSIANGCAAFVYQ